MTNLLQINLDFTLRVVNQMATELYSRKGIYSGELYHRRFGVHDGDWKGSKRKGFSQEMSTDSSEHPKRSKKKGRKHSITIVRANVE